MLYCGIFHTQLVALGAHAHYEQDSNCLLYVYLYLLINLYHLKPFSPQTLIRCGIEIDNSHHTNTNNHKMTSNP